MTPRLQQALLAAILLGYLILGVLFAAYTPPWQAPDEPAHYNYARYLAEAGRFPVLQMGDYPHDYLEEIKARGFPPDLSIAPIRYEFHQPPLYYLLAAPVYLIGRGALLPLRLLSVALGAGVVLLAFAVGRRIYPGWPALALGSAAFVAFLPQHLAAASQVGNDILAELLFGLVLLQLAGWTLRGTAAREHGSTVVVGILLGLILITKTTAYIAVPLALGVLLWRWRREHATARRIVGDLLAVLVPAAVLALPWYARNLATYGWPDFLGLNRHDAVVVGQMRLGDYLVQFGWGPYLRRLVEFTFKSTWGVFGWLGVFMDSRVYLGLAVLSGMAAGGVVLRVACCVFRRAPGAAPVAANPRPALWLLAVTFLLTLLAYGWYNLQFVQHQGRYLFTALIPIAVGFGLGWQEALRPRSSRLIAAALVVAGLTTALLALIRGHSMPVWPLACLVASAAGLVAQEAIGRRVPAARGVFFALPYLGLPMLALYALFGAIIPQLAG